MLLNLSGKKITYIVYNYQDCFRLLFNQIADFLGNSFSTTSHPLILQYNFMTDIYILTKKFSWSALPTLISKEFFLNILLRYISINRKLGAACDTPSVSVVFSCTLSHNILLTLAIPSLFPANEILSIPLISISNSIQVWEWFYNSLSFNFLVVIIVSHTS